MTTVLEERRLVGGWGYVPSAPLVNAIGKRPPSELLREFAGRERANLERALERARRTERITARAADTLAVRLLGRHPIEIWGKEWPA